MTFEWTIYGVGLNASDVAVHMDPKKMTEVIKEAWPEEDMTAYANADADELLDAFFDGDPAGILIAADGTYDFESANDGEGDTGYYFVLPPRMPWQHSTTEPHSLDETRKRIIAATQKVTNLQAYEIREMIEDNLCVHGFG